MKINCDGSFCVTSSICRVKVMVRDWRGAFVHAKLNQGLATSPLMPECLAAKMALTTAKDLGLTCLVLQGDSLDVISLLQNPLEDTPWIISTLIQDCLSIIKTFTVFRCLHVRHCANSVANHIVKHGVSSFRLESWSSSLHFD